MIWSFAKRTVTIGRRPLVMGIVNVTPDSFSDGGRYATATSAVAHGMQLAAEGADFLDIGGESSRPGSQPVPEAEELARVIPVVRELAQRTTVPISIDTTKASVAAQALDAGAVIINDISAGTHDAAMLDVVRAHRAGYILMHMQGIPATMHLNPTYTDVVAEVRAYLAARLATCEAAGITREQLVVDPGIGFGKNQEHSLALLRHLDQLVALQRPVLLGVSRKGFIGLITGRERHERMAGTLAVNCFCAALATAHILRVHDVAPTVDAAKLYAAIHGEHPSLR